MAWKYGMVLKGNLTKSEANQFDVVAPMSNKDIEGNVLGDPFVSVESLNWAARHDKVVNDAKGNSNSILIATKAQRRTLGNAKT